MCVVHCMCQIGFHDGGVYFLDFFFNIFFMKMGGYGGNFAQLFPETKHMQLPKLYTSLRIFSAKNSLHALQIRHLRFKA